jgi:putative nucleotidyltransferase with HDIG domain
LVLVGLVFVVALTALLTLPLLPAGEADQVTLQEGDVVRNNILASRHLEYVSDIETERERKRAATSVENIYYPPDTRVARQQIARAQAILDYVNSVRQDTFATPEERVVYIQAILDPDALHRALTQDRVQQILDLSDSAWLKVGDEVLRVLDQAMRAQIREHELSQTCAGVRTLVDFRLNDQEGAIVNAVVCGLLAPNTFVNVEQTEVARQEARDGVQPVMRVVKADEVVLREGDIVTDLDLEALQALGLVQRETNWREVAGVLILVLLTTLILGLSLARYQPNLLTGRSRNVALVGLLFIALVALAKLIVPGRTVLPYLFPAAALSMSVTVLLNSELAVIITLLLASLVGHIADGSLGLATYAAAGGLVAALVLRRVERVNAFFRVGVFYVGLTNLAVVCIFYLPRENVDPVGMLELTVAALVNGLLAASLTLAVFFIVSNFFDVTTALKLLELLQPSHPLLHQLLTRAPGTYHHCLLIANLAEQAAERIGADALLTRVGAFYHDIGKTVRPHFFTENQMDGVNPHDHLDPYTSADILRSHVTDGLDLARRYRLPSRVQAFISEHHGDSFVSFMYQQAVEAADGDASQVDESRFRYVGPKPQSRETALLMLADTAEAIAKSKRPGSVEELQELVSMAITVRLQQGQLDECDLSLRDLQTVRESFVNTLKGLYHTRIEYPEPKRPAQLPSESR